MGLLSKLVETVWHEVEDVVMLPIELTEYDRKCGERKDGVRCRLRRAHEGDHDFREEFGA